MNTCYRQNQNWRTLWCLFWAISFILQIECRYIAPRKKKHTNTHTHTHYINFRGVLRAFRNV